MKKILLALLASALCFYSCESPANDDETPDNGDNVGAINDNGTVDGLNSGKTSAVWDGSFDISWYDANATLLLISTPEQLAGMAELVKSGTLFYKQTIVLQNNILLNKKIETDETDKVTNSDELRVWEGIGIDRNTPFEGIFDGKGHYISGIYGNSLFNYCHNRRTSPTHVPQIKNVGIVNSYITVGNAAICSESLGGVMISKCYNMGFVAGTSYAVAGIISKINSANIVGGNGATVEHCFNAGKLTSPNYTAGIVGVADKTSNFHSSIRNCYSTTPCYYEITYNPKYSEREYYASVYNCYVLSGSVGIYEYNDTYFYSSPFSNSGVITSGTNKGKTLLECLNESGDNWIIKEGVNNGFPILKY